MRVDKARLRGKNLTWWKFIQEERENMDKKLIANYKAMVTKIKEQYLPKDYAIQLHKKRKNLKKGYGCGIIY